MVSLLAVVVIALTTVYVVLRWFNLVLLRLGASVRLLVTQSWDVLLVTKRINSVTGTELPEELRFVVLLV
jgi:hypothetical protein